MSALIGMAGAAIGSWAALGGEVGQIRLEAVVPVRCGIEIARHDVALDLAAGFDRTGPAFGDRHDFALSAPAVSGLSSGSYRDTVTITIAAR